MKNDLMKIVFALGEYYDKKLTQSQLEMYAEDLAVLTPNELSFAIRRYRADPANEFFPRPAKLVALARPEDSDLDVGRVVAARIMTAIGKFGWTQPEAAKAFIGELGWSVVTLQGGWQSICALDRDVLRGEQPRLRDLAVSVSQRARAGTLSLAPKLPESTASLIEDGRQDLALSMAQSVGKRLSSI